MVHAGTGVSAGEEAHVLPCAGSDTLSYDHALATCQQVAHDNAFGGFTVIGGMAHFYFQEPAELEAMKQPEHGSELHVRSGKAPAGASIGGVAKSNRPKVVQRTPK